MTKDKGYWSGVLEAANQQLAGIREERRELEKRRHILNGEIIRLEQLIASLTPLVSEQSTRAETTFVIGNAAEIGLTDACREVLRKTEQSTTPRRIKEMLEHAGYNTGQHLNPLASIHGVLKRLVESGEVERMENNDKTFYRWVGEKRATTVRVEMAPPRVTEISGTKKKD